MLDKEFEGYLEKYETLYQKSRGEIEREIPNLMKLWELFFDEIYTVTDIYKLMVEVKDKIEEDLKLDKTQEKLFEYWRICEDNILNDMLQYSFVYGYSLAMGLKNESERMLKEYNIENQDKKK